MTDTIKKRLADAGLRVKPLEWQDDPHGVGDFDTDQYGYEHFGEFSADQIICTCDNIYGIYQHSPGQFMWVDGTLHNVRFSTYRKSPEEDVEIPWFPCVLSAKAAAQTDYETRILAALEDME